MEKLECIQNSISISDDKNNDRFNEIKKDLKNSDDKQTNNQKLAVLITLALTYVSLGVTALFTLVTTTSTTWFVIACFVLSGLFMLLGIIRPKWLRFK